MPAQIAVFNADNYTSTAEALSSGAFYTQNSDWTFDDYTGLQDLLEVCDAINQCHNGEKDRNKAQFVLVIRDGDEWLPLSIWTSVREEIELARRSGQPHLDKGYITETNATKIGEVNGVSFYEHPTKGDEAPLLMVYGSLIGSSSFWELPEEGDF